MSIENQSEEMAKLIYRFLPNTLSLGMCKHLAGILLQFGYRKASKVGLFNSDEDKKTIAALEHCVKIDKSCIECPLFCECQESGVHYHRYICNRVIDMLRRGEECTSN